MSDPKDEAIRDAYRLISRLRSGWVVPSHLEDEILDWRTRQAVNEAMASRHTTPCVQDQTKAQEKDG